MTTTEKTEEKEAPDPRMFIGIYEEFTPERKQTVYFVRTDCRENAESKYAEFLVATRGGERRVEGGPLIEIPLPFHKAVETVLLTAFGIPPLGYQNECIDPEPLFVMVFEMKDGFFHAMPLVNNGNMEIGLGAVVRDSMPETGGEALSILATALDRMHCGIGWRQR